MRVVWEYPYNDQWETSNITCMNRFNQWQAFKFGTDTRQTKRFQIKSMDLGMIIGVVEETQIYN